MSTLQKMRARAGKTVREVSVGLGVTERTYSRWEHGYCRPDACNLLRLADYFGVEPRSLVVDQGDRA